MFVIPAPSSKSYAQRAVAAAALASGSSLLRGVDLSDDTRAALGVAEALGAAVCPEGADWRITGCGGVPQPRAGELFIGESGLSTRLFTPIAGLCANQIVVTGHGSILRRPMSMMFDPLRDLGVSVSATEGAFLPLTVCGPIVGGRTIEVDGSLSSQFLTGLLTALPLADGDTILKVKDLTSKPYIDITLDVLRSFGVEVTHQDYETFFIKGHQRYQATDYMVEGDWSGASCLLVLQAISGRTFEVGNLNPHSVQADRAIVEALKKAEGLRPFEFDATQCPDLFPALVALAAHCDGVSTLRGVDRLAHKESDRGVALQVEFGKLGVKVDLSERNTMNVYGGGGIKQGVLVSAWGDHRIAMATAVAGWNRGVVVDCPEVVAKSYPMFWRDLGLACSVVGL